MKNLEIYFSVDIEASGPIPGEYSMLSLGACRVDFLNQHFYAELKPVSDRFVPEALRVSGFNLDKLAHTGQEPRLAMLAFNNWLTASTEKGTPIFVGFNASFDWSFVNWYFHKFLGANPFGIGALDIKAYYMGLTGCRWQETRSSKLPASLHGEDEPKEPHNALSDAVRQAKIFRRIIDLRTDLLRR
jgi:DNA polymerase III epsilon subunit-like protein